MLANKVTKLLKQRGKTADFLIDLQLRDDGSGSYIAAWDESKLGPRPAQEELDAIDVTADLHNAGIDRQIVMLEAQITTRMLVEAAAGFPFQGYLLLVEQITALRLQRKKG